MEYIKNILNYSFSIGTISFSIKSILIIILVFIATYYLLKFLKKILYSRLKQEAKIKFKTLFSFFNYFIYLIVIFITLQNLGINVNGIFAASAALLIGVGLALQTFFQDIISGIFIIADQTVRVGDIVEVENKTLKIDTISLRTTRAVTLDNKVLIIPNHKFLTSTFFNWTENGSLIREGISIGVAYGSNVEKVKTLLIEIVSKQEKVLKTPAPVVIFSSFGDNSLNFKVFFSVNDSFKSGIVKSNIRFEICKVFEENKITIPFPQRTVWIQNKKN